MSKEDGITGKIIPITITIIIVVLLIVTSIPIVYSIGDTSTIYTSTATDKGAIKYTDDFTYTIDYTNNQLSVESDQFEFEQTMSGTDYYCVVSEKFIGLFTPSSVSGQNYLCCSVGTSFGRFEVSKSYDLTISYENSTVTMNFVDGVQQEKVINDVDWIYVCKDGSSDTDYLYDEKTTAYIKDNESVFFTQKITKSSNTSMGAVFVDNELVYGEGTLTLATPSETINGIKKYTDIPNGIGVIKRSDDASSQETHSIIKKSITVTESQSSSNPVAYTIIGAIFIVMLCAVMYFIVKRNKE